MRLFDDIFYLIYAFTKTVPRTMEYQARNWAIVMTPWVLVVHGIGLYYIGTLITHTKMAPVGLVKQYVFGLLALMMIGSFQIYYRKKRASSVIDRGAQSWCGPKAALFGGILILETLVLPALLPTIVRILRT